MEGGLLHGIMYILSKALYGRRLVNMFIGFI
jgi:hypothetical protein